MIKPTERLLLVDDEQINIELLETFLSVEPYELHTATNGNDALEMLENDPEKYDTILLDRVMPGLNGMDLLLKIKLHPKLKSIPVIFQTSKDKKEDVLEGIKAGAYYYLTKPYEPETLLAVVRSAVNEYGQYRHLKDEANNKFSAFELLISGRFEIFTLPECKNLSSLMANVCPEPNKAVLGLWELLCNAVEHGNLGISYKEKGVLNEKNKWQVEVDRRMALPENIDKKVVMTYERAENTIRFIIQDQGKGFDWEKYLSFDPDRAFDSHGRGIAMAATHCFDKIEYKGAGNIVEAVIHKKNG